MVPTASEDLHKRGTFIVRPGMRLLVRNWKPGQGLQFNVGLERQLFGWLFEPVDPNKPKSDGRRADAIPRVGRLKADFSGFNPERFGGQTIDAWVGLKDPN